MAVTPDLQRTARELSHSYAATKDGADLQFLANNGGFSGARLWKVSVAGLSEAAYTRNQYCLRAWPPDQTDEHLEFMHGLLDTAVQAGLPYVPRVQKTLDGRTRLHAANRFWELMSWQPGAADFHEHPSAERLRAAVRCLAQLHGLWADRGRGNGGTGRRGDSCVSHSPSLPVPLSPSSPCPAIFKRVNRLEAWSEERFRHIDQLLQSLETSLIRELSRTAVEHLRYWTKPALQALIPWSERSAPVQPCICDIWHDHVLYTRDEVTGIIDYGSVDRDTVSADLARLLGSMAGDNAKMYAAGLDAYQALRPLSADELTLVGLLDWTGVVVAAGNWLRWLYFERRQYENETAVAGRLAALVTRMKSWKTNLILP